MAIPITTLPLAKLPNLKLHVAGCGQVRLQPLPLWGRTTPAPLTFSWGPTMPPPHRTGHAPSHLSVCDQGGIWPRSLPLFRGTGSSSFPLQDCIGASLPLPHRGQMLYAVPSWVPDWEHQLYLTHEWTGHCQSGPLGKKFKHHCLRHFENVIHTV